MTGTHVPKVSGHNAQCFVTQYTQDPPSVTLWTTTNIISDGQSRPTLQPAIMDDPALRCNQRLWTIPPYAVTSEYGRSRPTPQPTSMDDPALRWHQRIWMIPPYAGTNDYGRSHPTLQPTSMDDPALHCNQRLTHPAFTSDDRNSENNASN